MLSYGNNFCLNKVCDDDYDDVLQTTRHKMYDRTQLYLRRLCRCYTSVAAID